MPHKVNAAHRQGSPRAKRRVTNWKDYDAALRQRGSLTVWLTEEAITAWQAEPRTTEVAPGGGEFALVGQQAIQHMQGLAGGGRDHLAAEGCVLVGEVGIDRCRSARS